MRSCGTSAGGTTRSSRTSRWPAVSFLSNRLNPVPPAAAASRPEAFVLRSRLLRDDALIGCEFAGVF